MGSAVPPQGTTDYSFPMPEEADELLDTVLEHYVKHHEVVLRKLEHAQSATAQGIQEIKTIGNTPKEQKAENSAVELERYDELWDSIIEMFRSSGISEEELSQIEQVLTMTPKIIRKYYELLTQQDKILQELIVEMNSEKYTQALNVVNKVQSQPNPMTMLPPEEYDLDSIPQTEKVQAYKFVPSLKRLH